MISFISIWNVNVFITDNAREEVQMPAPLQQPQGQGEQPQGEPQQVLVTTPCLLIMILF